MKEKRIPSEDLIRRALINEKRESPSKDFTWEILDRINSEPVYRVKMPSAFSFFAKTWISAISILGILLIFYFIGPQYLSLSIEWMKDFIIETLVLSDFNRITAEMRQYSESLTLLLMVCIVLGGLLILDRFLRRKVLLKTHLL